jgi:hypothetical protein
MIAALTSLQMTIAAALSSIAPRGATSAPVRLKSQSQRDAADRVLGANDCDDLADRLDAEYSALLPSADASAKPRDSEELPKIVGSIEAAQ